jgi:pimeloyl-ACP methyl ester carboxylesterase
LLTNTGDMTHANAQAAHALRPDFGWAEIPGGGIDICDEAPEAWAWAIIDFLATLPA